MLVEIHTYYHAFDKDDGTPLLIMRDTEENRMLPIVVDLMIRSAIIVAEAGIKSSLPLSYHELIINILEATGTCLEKTEITDISDGFFHALLHMRHNDEPITIDSNAGDAIALAICAGVPIYAEEDLLDMYVFEEIPYFVSQLDEPEPQDPH